MPQEFLVAMDVGTTNCKTVIFDKLGRIQSVALQEVDNIHNRLGPGWVEIDVERLWNVLCSTVRKAVSQADIRPDEIAGVGVTTLRQTIVPVDEGGNPLRYAIPWCVKSTYPQADWIRENIGPETVYRITGLTIDPLWALPSVLYLKAQEPDVFSRTHKIVEVQDFIVHRLGVDRFVTDYSQASCISLLDITTLQWSEELLEKLELSSDLLPELVPPGTVVGAVSATASKETGLPNGCPIVLAGGDSQCSALGCGVVSEGTASVVIGTSAVAMAYSERPVLDPKRRLVTHPHCVPGQYVLDHNTLTGGLAYRWFRDQLCRYESEYARSKSADPYELINLEVSEVPVGSHGVVFVPHFVGAASPYWNDRARGVLLGLSPTTTRSDIGRALVEGVAMEVKKGFNIMEALGVEVREVRLSGGACRPTSPWTKIQADVYGKPVILLKTSDTTALGAAILAAYGVSLYSSVPEAVGHMVHVLQRVEPNAEATRSYESLLSIQERAYWALAQCSIFEDLAEWRAGRVS